MILTNQIGTVCFAKRQVHTAERGRPILWAACAVFVQHRLNKRWFNSEDLRVISYLQNEWNLILDVLLFTPSPFRTEMLPF